MNIFNKDKTLDKRLELNTLYIDCKKKHLIISETLCKWIKRMQCDILPFLQLNRKYSRSITKMPLGTRNIFFQGIYFTKKLSNKNFQP